MAMSMVLSLCFAVRSASLLERERGVFLVLALAAADGGRSRSSPSCRDFLAWRASGVACTADGRLRRGDKGVSGVAGCGVLRALFFFGLDMAFLPGLKMPPNIFFWLELLLVSSWRRSLSSLDTSELFGSMDKASSRSRFARSCMLRKRLALARRKSALTLLGSIRRALFAEVTASLNWPSLIRQVATFCWHWTVSSDSAFSAALTSCDLTWPR
mmetsp:Transcript_10704/g.27032  ORF Transcript_10704/g.27032 Transcript_10704/m.27032 type:complete len:214 (+) Transcript_10704:135-776(+)